MLMMMSSLTRRSRSSAPPLLQSTPRRNLSLSTAMGQQFSMSAPPAGAHVMALEERGTCGGCGPRKWDPACRQPPAASGWSADRWQTFALEMGELVKGYRRDGYACYAMLLIPAGVGLMLISLSTGLGSEKCEPPPPAPPPPSTPYGSPEDGKPVPWDGCRGFNFMYLIHFPFILIAIIVFFCCLYHTKPNNQRVDGLITDLCRRYSDHSVTLQFMTEYTEVCKPKNAQTYRALYVIPNGAAVGYPAQGGIQMQPMGGMQLMQVTCPPGSKAGDPLQIQTSSGPMQIVVPAGVTAGMPFRVEVPSMPTATAVPMATPVK